jgi:hypothetical protein
LGEFPRFAASTTMPTTFIDLSYNQLTGSMPIEWRKLTAVTTLNLRRNQYGALTFVILDFIQSLKGC